MQRNVMLFFAWITLVAAIAGTSVLASSQSARVNFLSCIRSNDVRRSQLGEENYALDAAAARRQSAKIEAKTSPAQAQIDLSAARAFVTDASHIHIALLNCTDPGTAT